MPTTHYSSRSDGYEFYYGLAESPFALSADPRFSFDSKSCRAVRELIIEEFHRPNALIVVTGTCGVGKSVLLRTMLERLPGRTFPALVTNASVSFEDLLKQILDDFGVLSKGQATLSAASRQDLTTTLVGFLRSLSRLRARAVIFIDDAQQLSVDAFEQLCLLSNIDGDGPSRLQIVMVGLPSLSEILSGPEMQRIQQRISLQCVLQPLDSREVHNYIDAHLGIAYGDRQDTIYNETLVRFEPAAVSAIADCSEGIPRLMNALCDRALMNAYVRGKPTVDERAVFDAARALEISIPLGTRLRRYGIAASASVIVLAALVGAAWLEADLRHVRPPEVARLTPDALVHAATLHQGQSFSILVASVRSADEAQTVHAQAASLGLPVFIYERPEGHQVMLGPYASREEAVEVQRRLDTASLTGSQVVSSPTPDIGDAASDPEPSTVWRALLLEAPGRTSIVIELPDDALQAVALANSDDHSFGVAIGPLRDRVATQDLHPAQTRGVVSGVKVRGVTDDNDALAHVTVQARLPIEGTVRLAKRRVYMDLMPVATAAGPPAVVVATERTVAEPAVGSRPPAPDQPPGVSPSGGWERAMLAQALEFSKVPNVHGLEHLRADLLQRRSRSAEKASAAGGDRVMTELDRYLESAQRLQLAIDRRLFLKAQDPTHDSPIQ